MKRKRTTDRELETWARKATRGVQESGTFLSLWSQKMKDDPLSSPEVVVQIGLAVLLDRPIVIVAPHGAEIPENIRRVARSIKFYMADDLRGLQVATKAALTEAGIVPTM